MKQNFFVLLLCAALISLYTYTSLENKPVRIITPEQPAEIVNVKTIADSIDRHYQSELLRLENVNDSMQVVINSDKQTLGVSRRKVSFLQQKVVLLSQQLNVTADTSAKINICDSLQEKVLVLITESEIHDSLCDKTVNELSQLTHMKDSLLNVCKSSYILVKQNLYASIVQQELISGQLSLSEKKLRRRTNLNRWLAGGLAITGGVIATTVLLH